MIGLLTYSKIQEVADYAGVSRATVYRYLKDEEFMQQYQEKRSELLDDHVRSMQTHLSKALDTLAAIIDKKDASDQVIINAIDALFRNYYKMADLNDLTKRIDTLENL